MIEFKQGDVVCLNSDLEHKFTVNQIIPVGPCKGNVEVVYWDANRFKYESFPPTMLRLAPLETKDNKSQP